MDLWIRSQDKENLIKATGVRVIENHIQIRSDGLGILTIGVYKTKERALVVLDDIQNKILKGVMAMKTNGLGEVLDFIPNPIYIYEMPKE